MAKEYNPLQCQSLFGYAMLVHKRSGGICQLCGAGKGNKIDFDLWRQMTVEHILGTPKGGRAVFQIVAQAFSESPAEEHFRLASLIDDANTVTACNFCNSMTSRFDSNGESLLAMLNRFPGTPDEKVSHVIGEIKLVFHRKQEEVAWKLQAIRSAFNEGIEPALLQARSLQECADSP